MTSSEPPFTIRHYESLDSTNEEARRLAQSGEVQKIWIVADEQTAGRGRRGRVWVSPKGNLMTSLYLPGPFAPEIAGQLSFVAGLAIYDAVAKLIGDDSLLGLKWPNDLLLNGAKIAGILLEASASADRDVQTIAIGIGVNLKHHPLDTPYPATSLETMCDVPAPIQVLELLAACFDRHLASWRLHGFLPTRNLWVQRAYGIGGEITARMEASEISGIFEGISEDGNLQLRLPNGALETISAGDIYFPHLTGTKYDE